MQCLEYVVRCLTMYEKRAVAPQMGLCITPFELSNRDGVISSYLIISLGVNGCRCAYVGTTYVPTYQPTYLGAVRVTNFAFLDICTFVCKSLKKGVKFCRSITEAKFYRN
jgi:hypothetical protein